MLEDIPMTASISSPPSDRRLHSAINLSRVMDDPGLMRSSVVTTGHLILASVAWMSEAISGFLRLALPHISFARAGYLLQSLRGFSTGRHPALQRVTQPLAMVIDISSCSQEGFYMPCPSRCFSCSDPCRGQADSLPRTLYKLKANCEQRWPKAQNHFRQRFQISKAFCRHRVSGSSASLRVVLSSVFSKEREQLEKPSTRN